MLEVILSLALMINGVLSQSNDTLNNGTNSNNNSNINQFVYVTTWLQIGLGGLSLIGITQNFLAEYIFYKKGDSSEVKEKLEELLELDEEPLAIKEDVLNFASDILKKVKPMISDKGNTMDKEELLRFLYFARSLLKGEAGLNSSRDNNE